MFYCTPINYSVPYINTSWGLWQGAGVKLGVRVKQGIIKSLEIYSSKLETSCLHLTKSSGWNWSRLPRKTRVTLSHLCLTATHQVADGFYRCARASSFSSLGCGGLNQTCLHCAHPILSWLFQGWPKGPFLKVGIYVVSTLYVYQQSSHEAVLRKEECWLNNRRSNQDIKK